MLELLKLEHFMAKLGQKLAKHGQTWPARILAVAGAANSCIKFIIGVIFLQLESRLARYRAQSRG